LSETSHARVYDRVGRFVSDYDPVSFLLPGAIASDENVTVEILERELVTPSRAVDQLFRVTDERGSRLVQGDEGSLTAVVRAIGTLSDEYQRADLALPEA
jgi:hypothetical protein